MSETSTATTVGDLADLVPSWARSLRATNRSPKTLTTYVGAANQLIAFLAARGMPTDAAKVRREHVEAFFENVLARYRPATASNRYRAPARLYIYLVAEDEITESPMARMKPPHVPDVPVSVFGDDALSRILAACEGSGVRGATGHGDRPPVPGQWHATVEVGEPPHRGPRPRPGRGHRYWQGTPPAGMPVRKQDRPGHRPLPPDAREAPPRRRALAVGFASAAA